MQCGASKLCALFQGSLLLVVALTATGAVPERPSAVGAAASKAKDADSGWAEVDYADLVDRRRLSHSGESVGTLLRALDGRALPPAGERAADSLSHALLDPLLEPYAFVLADALDSTGTAPDTPLIEVGALWEPGEAQPAWAEILRARRLLVESDGEGRFRVCLPWPSAGRPGPVSGPPSIASAAAAEAAYEAAWSVLRHVFAAQRRRLARRDGNRAEDHPLEVEVHAYVHEQARTLFRLGMGTFRAQVTDTRPRGDRPPLDLDALQSFLDRGLQLEGGRLESDGTLRLLGSETTQAPTLLGRQITLADYAVAYRAVAHGGLTEPYMSLDRGVSPQTSIVNYGGRLRDTSLGLVSLLCDARFKTFSMGIDIVQDRDLREELRREIPSFHTHLERMAADARLQAVQGQQTRLWFYPDDVDLTLSDQGDVLVLRRSRMTASSERLQEGSGAPQQDPPWTVETVAAINRDYVGLGRFFPELLDLDQVARLLSLFTWLDQARTDRLPVGDLDALLALELPPLPTPRRFPQLLAFNALPPAGGSGPVEVFGQEPVVEALERLQPAFLLPLPAVRRFERARKALDRRIPDHEALAKEMEAVDAKRLDESTLDVMAFRAERLRMHQFVLSTLAPPQRENLARREQAGEKLRVFSVGIGGIDLSMRKSLARASKRSERLAWGAGGLPREGAAAASAGTAIEASGGVKEDWRRDPARLPETVLPEDGGRAAKPGESGPARVESGTSALTDGKKVPWVLTVMGQDGLDPASRRLVFDADRHVDFIERVEDHRFLRYRIEKQGATLQARRLEQGLPAPVRGAGGDQAPRPGLAILELGEPPASAGEGLPAEAPTLLLRLRGIGSTELAAPFPRAVLQRLVLGRAVDLTAGQPLPGLESPGQLLGGLRHLMVLMRAGQEAAPWEAPAAPVPGEEDPVRIAMALTAWWAGKGDAPGVVVGTDRAASPERWQRAPAAGREAALVLPQDAFPGLAARTRDDLAAAWKGQKVEAEIRATGGPALVVLVSGEAPGPLGRRLRRLSRDPALKGKLLAVYALAGAVREDLPSSLLAEGNLAGLGLAEAPVARASRVPEGLTSLAAALADSTRQDRRVEELPGPFLWFF